MKLRFFILSVVFTTVNTYAQDVHLTQYYTSNVSLNPAFTGDYVGDYRAVLNYRSQWKQVVEPITTSMVSLEKKFNHFTNDFGLGLIVINDRLPSFNLSTNKVMLSGSYSKKVGKSTFAFGLQGSYVARSMDLGNQTFPDQWNYSSGNFEPGKPSNENLSINSKSFFGLNTGVSFTKQVKRKTFSLAYGLFNVNRPNSGMIQKSNLPFRHVLNTSFKIPVNSMLYLKPMVLYMTTKGASDFVMLATLTKKLSSEMALMAGGGLRSGSINKDAFLAIIGYNYKRFEAGFSFDLNSSQLSKETSRKSVWEISLIYTTPSRTISKSTINCDRY